MSVPLHEIRIVFTRSQGPGGQNVNKVSSKAQLRWHVWNSKAFNTDEKAAISRALSSYITWGGEVILQSEQTRSQAQNKALVIRRLNQLVDKAIAPVKHRVPTKPTKSSTERRIERKKKHSQKKKRRSLIEFLFF